MATPASHTPRTTKPRRPAATEATPERQPPTPGSAWKDDPEKREIMIRLAAYAFYERRGCIAGDELQDWLLAEMEVDRQLAAGMEPDSPN